MNKNNYGFFGIKLAVGVVMAFGFFLHAAGAKAETLIVHDSSTVWSGSTDFRPVIGAFVLPPGAISYHAPSDFNISRVLIGANSDGSSNNHSLVGANLRAWILNSAGVAIASSVNTCYGEGACGGASLGFAAGTLIPKDFSLEFISDDGLQVDAGFSITNISVFGDTALPVPAGKEPIVIIPGMMGSVINKKSDGSEVWPSLSQMTLPNDAYLNDLALDAAGLEVPGREMSSTDIFRDASLFGVISKPIYGNLIRTFTNQGYVEGKDLFVAPYDWRRDLSSQFGVLDVTIASATKASPDGKIAVIAHSMGGLLMKAYLAARADNAFLDKLILVGVPQLGAPQAFQVLNYGDNAGIPILNSQEVKSISQNMPSAYDLLPSRRYVDVAGGYVQDFRNGGHVLNYDETKALMIATGTDSRNASLFSRADTFHGSLDGQAVKAPQIYNITGCFVPTVSGFQLYDDGVVDVRQSNGDGTVPQVSAMNLANGFNNYFVLGNETNIDHMGLVGDARPLSLMSAIVGATTSTSILLQGISTSTADCFTPRAGSSSGEMIAISVNNSTSLTAVDAAGNRTGIKPNGDVELGIPFSQFTTIGNNAFLVVPSGTAYRFIVGGAASTATISGATSSALAALPKTVTVKAKSLTANKVIKETTFVNVPLASPSTTAELDVSNASGTLSIKLDTTGDGIPDQTVPPTTTLSASSTEDIVPPKIILSQVPTSAVVGSAIRFSWTVTDASSGVAMVQATLNGQVIANGATMKLLQIGTSTLRIEAVDKAGNPAVLEKSIAVFAEKKGDPKKEKGEKGERDHDDEREYEHRHAYEYGHDRDYKKPNKVK